jgi:NAD(P)-dependent dehydrogenase (short-subunit alcohol dehydrogenase family)
VTAPLQDKVALITGAASGIGRATALLFAVRGAKVVLADVDEAGGRETAGRVAAGGGEGVFVACDVAVADQVEAVVRACLERFGRLDCAFNNAGIEGANVPTVEYDEETWNRVLAVNLTGVFLCMKYELRAMSAQGFGAIVNAASVVGVIGYPNLAAYNASKHGVVGLTRTAALEYAERGIRVNAVCPGWIETPMVMDRGPQPASIPEVHRAIADLHPLKRLGRPQEVAEAVAWLCSNAASFVTGQPILVDGGITAGRAQIQPGPNMPSAASSRMRAGE